MDISLFALLMFLSTALLFLAFFKKQIVLIIFSGIAFILLGIICINGLDYVSSTDVIIINTSFTSIVDNYSEWDHTFGSSDFKVTTALGFFLSLMGLFILVVSAVLLFGGKSGVNLSDDDSDDGD